MRNTKGISRASETEFQKGQVAYNRAPIGTVSVRKFTRSNDRRAFVKVAEPNVWKLRAHVVWEAAHGAIPPGMCVHHRDGDKLNDSPENLALLSVAEHLAEHVGAFREKCTAALVAARKARRWSTKSTTKRTGRPPAYTEEAMAAAIVDVQAGASPRAAGARHGVSFGAIYRRLRS